MTSERSELLSSPVLKMEALFSSETLLFIYQITRGDYSESKTSLVCNTVAIGKHFNILVREGVDKSLARILPDVVGRNR
jgi:hypothetical protein